MLDDLITALDGTGYAFAQYAWSKAPDGDYGTIGAYGEQNLWADGYQQEQDLICVVSYYTRDPSGTPRKTIEAAFAAADVSWYVESISFESDSGYIHYTWTVEFPEEDAGDG